MLLKSVDVQNFVKEDYEAYKGEQMAFFRERADHVNSQIEKIR
jgi:hypothetical protein